MYTKIWTLVGVTNRSIEPFKYLSLRLKKSLMKLRGLETFYFTLNLSFTPIHYYFLLWCLFAESIVDVKDTNIYIYLSLFYPFSLWYKSKLVSINNFILT